MKFLIVDDSATVKNMLIRAIKAEFPEATIVESSDGKAAFKELTRESFDLIITDLEMDGVDGNSFAQKVKGNKILAKKPIIIFTSKPEEASKLDGVYVVDKALGAEGVRKKILELIGKKS
jgi:DNA-binding response OmpR family regulator